MVERPVPLLEKASFPIGHESISGSLSCKEKKLKGVKVFFAEGWTPFPSKEAIASGRMIPGGTMKSDVIIAESIAAHGASVHMFSCKGEGDGHKVWKPAENTDEIHHQHQDGPTALVDELLRVQDNYDVIHLSSHVFLDIPELAKKFNENIRKPVIFTVTGSWIFSQVTAETLAKCTKIVCMSEGLAQMARDLGIPEDRIEVIPNTIDIDKEKPLPSELREEVKEQLGIPPNAVVFAAAGRISSEKGLGDLANIWQDIYSEAENKNIYLLILGKAADTDTNMQTLQRQLERMKDKHILSLGWVDPAPYFAATDYVIFRSAREGMSNVMLEAAAMERPTIGPLQTPGFVDVIQHQRNGFLYDYDSWDHMKQVIKEAVKLKRDNHEQYEQMGKAARQRMVDYHSPQAISQQYASVYQKLVFQS